MRMLRAEQYAHRDLDVRYVYLVAVNCGVERLAGIYHEVANELQQPQSLLRHFKAT